MVRKDFIICKTRDRLAEFINPIAEAADKPRRRFLLESIIGPRTLETAL